MPKSRVILYREPQLSPSISKTRQTYSYKRGEKNIRASRSTGNGDSGLLKEDPFNTHERDYSITTPKEDGSLDRMDDGIVGGMAS
ncbi:hypothetical protein FPOAC1_004976 [Fusarium poae]|uniref:hypothetical protein n=1 Tax=Fusarium poae TaxID=36050 RepID=UPI001CE834E6|nr:hypothetical protein FPOAC1_004976 [Fusarium poae]KAG8671721.1 hypothetical protein FPOAC1_004976 [Fusarium poae]